MYFNSVPLLETGNANILENIPSNDVLVIAGKSVFEANVPPVQVNYNCM